MNPYDLLAADCATQEGATDADINAALAMELPTTKGGKCLNACIGEKTGIVSTTLNEFTNEELHQTFQFISVTFMH